MTDQNPDQPIRAAMVVYHDTAQLTWLGEQLRMEGLEVRGFDNAAAALAAMNGIRPPAIIVTGLHMPGIDGWRFCRLLRSPDYAPLNQVPVLVVSTTVAEEEAARITVDLGANAFLALPLEAQKFREQVRMCLEGENTPKMPRVLIVDDDANATEILQQAFELNGYRADVALTGQQAEHLCKAQDYEVVILDHGLPDTRGDQLLMALKQLRPNAVYLAITGNPQPELALEWMKLGVSAFVNKPFVSQYLIELCAKARRERDLLLLEGRLEARTRELRESEQRFRTVLRTAMDGFWLADPQGRLLQVNDSYCRMSGYDEAELLGMTMAGLEADQAEKTASHLRKIIATGADRFETRHRRKDGSIFDVEVSILYRPIEGGRLMAFLRDITEHKRAQTELLESEERYRTLFDRANEGIALVSDEGRLIAVNESFATMHGYSVDEMLYMSLRDLGRAETIGNFFGQMQRVLSGETIKCEVEHYHKYGHLLPLEASASLISSTGKTFIQCFYRDITDRKRAEAERARLQAQFHQAQKMEDIGQLAGILAHDFNHIMASTITHLSLLQKQAGLDPQMQEMLEGLLGEAKRAASLTRQLLIFSRKSVLEIEILDLNVTVSNLLPMLAQLAGDPIDLRFEGSSIAPIVEADERMIEQALMNLVVNARDAMPGGGFLAIRLACLQVGFDQVKETSPVRQGKFVCLSVADTGCGMDPATQDRIFEPFFTTKEAGKGTGLGLAAVHGIVVQHRGWIEVQSQPGQGAAFNIFLPAAANSSTGE
jgi:PAS domain S-box-containing protein